MSLGNMNSCFQPYIHHRKSSDMNFEFSAFKKVERKGSYTQSPLLSSYILNSPINYSKFLSENQLMNGMGMG